MAGRVGRWVGYSCATMGKDVAATTTTMMMMMAATILRGAELAMAACESCGAGSPPANFSAYNYLAIQGPNSTAGYNTVQCGGPLNGTQPNNFGALFCFDMPLLTAPNLASASTLLIGRVQGNFEFAAQAGGIVFVTETFSVNVTSSAPAPYDNISNGTFTGVGLEHLGRYSSKPITGGTDAYRLVAGVAFTTPLSNGTDAFNNTFVWFRYDFTFSCAC